MNGETFVGQPRSLEGVGDSSSPSLHRAVGETVRSVCSWAGGGSCVN